MPGVHIISTDTTTSVTAAGSSVHNHHTQLIVVSDVIF